jgi:capsular polysaccharide biosynthesis protein
MDTFIKIFKNFIKKNKNISKPFIRTIFNKRYAPSQQIVKIKDIQQCDENRLEILFPEKKIICHLPKLENNISKAEETVTPKVAFYKFENATVDADSTAFLYKNKLIANRFKDERFNEGFVVYHNQNHAKIRLTNLSKIKNGFFLGGNGSWNWYHFLIEIAPKLLLIEANGIKTILVNEIVLQYSSMQKIIELLGRKFEIIYLKRHQQYQVEKLYYINDFNHVQFNRFDGKITSDGTYFNEILTKLFSEKIINSLKINNPNTKNIFLYRKNTHRIAKNQDEILNFLIQHDYTPVCLEELNIKQQIECFYHAKNIIGISGAAWSNLIFCRNKPNAICFIPNNAKEFSVFSNLAKIFSVNLISQVYENKALHSESDFTIDIENFKNLFFEHNA